MENLLKFIETSMGKNKNSIDFINKVFKTSPVGIVFKDSQFRYKIANETFCKYFEIKDLKDFVGIQTINGLTQTNIDLLKKINYYIAKNFKPKNYVMSYKSKSFNVMSYPLGSGDNFSGIISIINEITDDEDLKESFVRKYCQIESLLERLPLMVYVQDRNFNFEISTSQVEKFFNEGYDSYTNLYFKPQKIVEENWRSNMEIVNSKSITQKEVLLRCINDLPHWYKVRKIPIKDFTGNVSGIISIVMNIDKEKILQAQRESYVASISHDLKNPTIAQMRTVELMLKGTFGEINPTQQELLEMILDSCRYMHGMLASILSTYRNYCGSLELNFIDFSFKELIKECILELAYVAKDKEIEILTNFVNPEEIIIADMVQIKRVVMNLLSNGIKYAIKNSKLIININIESGVLKFSVESNSPYISEAKQKNIFAKYITYAATNKELGCGLGLYTSKKIIEAHNGTIALKSFKDNRNIFSFEIPQKQNLNKKTQKISL